MNVPLELDEMKKPVSAAEAAQRLGQLLSTAEAARRLGITQGAVSRRIQEGTLPAIKVARDWLVDITGAQDVRRGRRLTKAKRCPCNKMTLKRAKARGQSKEHEPSCPFFHAS